MMASADAPEYRPRRQRFARRRARVPVELRRAEGLFGERIGWLVAQRAVGGCEFGAPAVAHGVRQRALKIAEERKRLPRSPFLAHEQERRHRREQGDGKRGGNFRLARLGDEAVAERAVTDLVVVLEKIGEGERGERAGGFTARAVAAMRGN